PAHRDRRGRADAGVEPVVRTKYARRRTVASDQRWRKPARNVGSDQRRKFRTPRRRIGTWRLEQKGTELVHRRQSFSRRRMARRIALGCSPVFRQTRLEPRENDTDPDGRVRRKLAA